MALIREKIVKEDLNLGYGSTTITTDSGGSLSASKIGLHTLLANAPSLESFGAVGDGVSDDTAAFTAAFTALSSGGALFCPGQYKITSALTIPASTVVFGLGRGKSKILKRFSGTLLTMGSNSGLERLWIDGGNSQGYTGVSVSIASGLYQYLNSCQMDNSESYCVEYSADAGAGGYIADSLIGGRPDPYVAIKLPLDTTASPRTFSNIQGGGAILFDFNGANDVFVDNCFSNRLSWTGGASTSTNVMLNNCRIAGSATTISGGQTHIIGCSFASAVTLDSNSSNCVFADSIVPSYAITDNGSGNAVDIRGASYTPTWTQASGTQPAIGNGTIEGTYTRNGRTVTVWIKWTAGSTTTFGNSGVGYLFSLPYTVAASPTEQAGVAFISDASGPATTTAFVQAAAAATAVTISDMTSGAVRATSPITFASGDSIRIALTYLI